MCILQNKRGEAAGVTNPLVFLGIPFFRKKNDEDVKLCESESILRSHVHYLPRPLSHFCTEKNGPFRKLPVFEF